jgi:hypothetical protein
MGQQMILRGSKTSHTARPTTVKSARKGMATMTNSHRQQDPFSCSSCLSPFLPPAPAPLITNSKQFSVSYQVCDSYCPAAARN